MQDNEFRYLIYCSSRMEASFNVVNVTNIALDFGNLAGAVGTVGGPTPARLELNLRQGGALQDVKHIAFKLAPDPADLPTPVLRPARPRSTASPPRPPACPAAEEA